MRSGSQKKVVGFLRGCWYLQIRPIVLLLDRLLWRCRLRPFTIPRVSHAKRCCLLRQWVGSLPSNQNLKGENQNVEIPPCECMSCSKEACLETPVRLTALLLEADFPTACSTERCTKPSRRLELPARKSKSALPSLKAYHEMSTKRRLLLFYRLLAQALFYQIE